MIAALDLVAAACFATALVIIVYALASKPEPALSTPRLLALAAMAVMVAASTGNLLQNLGVNHLLADLEGYTEVMFLPLLAYMMLALHAQGLAAKARREQTVIDRLGERLNNSMTETGAHRFGMLQALSAAVDARDHYTAQHSMHVADYACAIGYSLGMKDQLMQFEQAGLLHDIGKIGVPDALLMNTDPLSDDEYEVLKKHVEEGARIVGSIAFMQDVVPIMRHHHERWDGGGYPDGLAREAIPRAARVLAVADAFDAMTTDRPYHKAMDVDEATATLRSGSGTHWDPEVVEALLSLLDRRLITVAPSV